METVKKGLVIACAIAMVVYSTVAIINQMWFSLIWLVVGTLLLIITVAVMEMAIMQKKDRQISSIESEVSLDKRIESDVLTTKSLEQETLKFMPKKCLQFGAYGKVSHGYYKKRKMLPYLIDNCTEQEVSGKYAYSTIRKKEKQGKIIWK